MKKIFIVKDEFVNSRLDRWFRRNVFDIPQSLIEKNIRKGNIKVNKKKEKSSYKLKIKDLISIYNINYSENKNLQKSEKYRPTKKELNQSSEILIENNENYVVVNKPEGISVQSGTKSRRNILDILSDMNEFKEKSPFAVHRIDKETSGILIVAKNRKYAQLFTSLFRIRKIHKIYLCIVLGEIKNKTGVLIDNLFHYEGKKKIKAKAITRYSVIDSNFKYSLLKLNPETGRKHQLRKQLLIHGNPILGDNKYRIFSNFNKNKSKLMLHAYKIYFSINGIKYNYSAEPPIYFKRMLREKNLKIS